MNEMYANGVNLSGLYSKKIMRVKFDPDTKMWWDSEGEFSVEKIGTSHYPSMIIFASDKYQEVEAWTQGVRATMEILRKWATV